MKWKPVVALCVSCLVALPALSQTETGSWEFSLAGNLGSRSASMEYTSGGYTETSEMEAQEYIALDLRTGYYIVDGLSLEPEIYWLAVKSIQPMFNIGANVAYTFNIPGSGVKPFLIAGYGIGNSNPMMQRLADRASGDLDIPVLRLGGGIKFFLSKQVALKAEYRYERYTQEASETGYYYYPYSYSYSYTLVSNYHNVLLGFSIFLPSGD